MYTLTTRALLQEYITDTPTNAKLPKKVRLRGDIDLEGQVLNINNRITLVGDHLKGTRIVCNGGNIRANSTWVNLRDLAVVMSGGGCAVHVNYARFHADNVLINNDNSASRTKGTAFAFDSISEAGAQVGGAYTSVISNTHMNDSSQQCKHFASGVTYVPLTGISGTFQYGETVTATGASGEIMAVYASAIKLVGAQGDFTGKTITGATSGATATGGAEVETQFNSNTFRDCNVIAPYAIHYRAGGGSKINGGQWQSGGASATGSLITQRGVASGFLLTGAPYIEKYSYIQDSDNGTNQYVHADVLWSDNNGANSNYPSRFITGGGSYTQPAIATQAEAEAGTDNTKMMTPLRVAQAIAGGSPPPAEVLIDLSAQTVTGNMTDQGGLSSLYDGNKNKAMLNCARYSSGGGTGTVIVDYGSGNSKVLKRVKTWASNNSGYDTTSSIVNVVHTGFGSNDGTNWVQLFTGTFADNNTVNQKDYAPTSTTAYRYHKLEQTAGGSAHPVLCQVEFYE